MARTIWRYAWRYVLVAPFIQWLVFAVELSIENFGGGAPLPSHGYLARLREALFGNYAYYGTPIIVAGAIIGALSHGTRSMAGSVAASVVLMAAIPLAFVTAAYLHYGRTLEGLGSYLTATTVLRLALPSMVSGFICACWCFKRLIGRTGNLTARLS